MSKHLNVLIIVIMLGVSVTFSVIYINKYVDFSSTDSLGPTVEADTQVPSKPEENLPDVEYSVFPRVAVRGKDSIVNVTGGPGSEYLCDSYHLGGSIYALISTDSNGDDYRARGQGIAVARFDEGCNLKETLTLENSIGCRYLCACPSASGLLIVASCTEGIRVWSVSTSMVSYQTNLPYVAESACAILDGEENIVSVCGERLYLFSLTPSLDIGFSFSVGEAGYEAFALYSYIDEYRLFVRGLGTGAVYRANRQGFIEKHVTMRADAVTPCETGFVLGGAREHATIEIYDYQMNPLSTLDLPRCETLTLSSYSGGVIVLLGDELNTTAYLLCSHGDLICSTVLGAGIPYGTPSYTDGRFVISCIEDQQITVYSYKPMDQSIVNLHVVLGAERAQIWTKGAYLFLACDTIFDYGDFTLKMGGRDVYLLRFQ